MALSAVGMMHCTSPNPQYVGCNSCLKHYKHANDAIPPRPVPSIQAPGNLRASVNSRMSAAPPGPDPCASPGVVASAAAPPGCPMRLSAASSQLIPIARARGPRGPLSHSMTARQSGTLSQTLVDDEEAFQALLQGALAKQRPIVVNRTSAAAPAQRKPSSSSAAAETSPLCASRMLPQSRRASGAPGWGSGVANATRRSTTSRPSETAVCLPPPASAAAPGRLQADAVGPAEARISKQHSLQLISPPTTVAGDADDDGALLEFDLLDEADAQAARTRTVLGDIEARLEQTGAGAIGMDAACAAAAAADTTASEALPAEAVAVQPGDIEDAAARVEAAAAAPPQREQRRWAAAPIATAPCSQPEAAAALNAETVGPAEPQHAPAAASETGEDTTATPAAAGSLQLPHSASLRFAPHDTSLLNSPPSPRRRHTLAHTGAWLERPQLASDRLPRHCSAGAPVAAPVPSRRDLLGRPAAAAASSWVAPQLAAPDGSARASLEASVAPAALASGAAGGPPRLAAQVLGSQGQTGPTSQQRQPERPLVARSMDLEGAYRASQQTEMNPLRANLRKPSAQGPGVQQMRWATACLKLLIPAMCSFMGGACGVQHTPRPGCRYGWLGKT